MNDALHVVIIEDEDGNRESYERALTKIGFCVLLGFAKTKRTSGKVAVVRSLDERITNRSVDYLPPTAPRGPADQLKAPELVEAAARK